MTLDRSRVTVRLATLADVELLADIGARTFADTFAGDNTREDMAAYLHASFGAVIQLAELQAAGSECLIAERDGSAVGYARLRHGPAPPCVRAEKPVEIVRFYVDSPHIGTGVGGALMAACLRRCVDAACDTAWLDVWERNPRAIAFYERWGFTVVGEQQFVLGADVQRDLIMARAMDNPHGTGISTAC